MTDTTIAHETIDRIIITSGAAYHLPFASRRFTVAVLDAGGMIFESRQFRNDWTAVRWAASWGVPIEADADQLREFIAVERDLRRTN